MLTVSPSCCWPCAEPSGSLTPEQAHADSVALREDIYNGPSADAPEHGPGKGVQIVTYASYREHSEDAGVALKALSVLDSLAMDSGTVLCGERDDVHEPQPNWLIVDVAPGRAPVFIFNHSLQEIIASMRELLHVPEVQRVGCSLLWSLAAESESHRIRITAKGGLRRVLDAMRRYPTNLLIMENACGLLRTLASSSKEGGGEGGGW